MLSKLEYWYICCWNLSLLSIVMHRSLLNVIDRQREMLQQDNALPHTAMVTMDILTQNNINVLPLSVFEPNRTSLGGTCRHVRQRQPPTQSLDQLSQALLHEWQRIPQVKIPNFIRSMPMRCRIVLAAHDGHNRYWL